MLLSVGFSALDWYVLREWLSDSCRLSLFFFFQAEDGIRDLVRSRGLGDVYKRQGRGRDRRLGDPVVTDL